jgi:hypothetical protein
MPFDNAADSSLLNCPRATIEARSEHHYWAAVSYTTYCRLVAGWNAAAGCTEPHGTVTGTDQAARCEFGTDGTLRFYLHRLP